MIEERDCFEPREPTDELSDEELYGEDRAAITEAACATSRCFLPLAVLE